MILNFKSYGQGPALIILHGLFGSLDNWVSHARRLSDEFSVYILDQRNHGKSPHAEEWDYQIMADDLADFMDQHGIYQAHLLGHSMGGKVVMQFAMDHPERIDRLVVADMAPKAYEPHHTLLLKTLNGIDLAPITNRAEVESMMRPGIPSPGVRQFLLKGLGRNGEKDLRWKFNLPVISEKYADVLLPIELEFPFEGPTLFISGGKSDYVLKKDHAEIRAGFPQAQFYVIAEAGHWLHADAPDAFLAEVRRFLLDETL
jgi:esterase